MGDIPTTSALLTLIRCVYDDALSTQNAEDEADRALALDATDRLAGDCERCFEPQDTGLTMSGGDAVCEECIEAELAEDLMF